MPLPFCLLRLRHSDDAPPTRVTGHELRRLAVALALLLPLAAAAPAQAWGRLGHRLAGEIAEGYLDDVTATRVRDLLGRESLAEASDWADRMRSDPAPFWQKEAGPYHYVTVPRGRRYSEVGAPPQGDAYTALGMFARELRDDNTSRSRRQLALRFAVHIIQDLHQPLHVGNGRDRGGNDVEVLVDAEPSNLHRLWDSQILYSAGRSDAQWSRHLRRSAHHRAPRSGEEDPLLWIGESGALRQTLYPPPRRAGDDYMREMLPIAEERLVLAGVRTAAWLNATLDDTSPESTGRGGKRWWQRLFGR